MKYEVRVTPMNREDSNLRGLATVVFADAFAVNGISILESAEGREYVSMPSIKTADRDVNGKQVYKEQAFPITSEFAATFKTSILDTLEAAKNGGDGKTVVDDEKKLTYRINVYPQEKTDSNVRANVSLNLGNIFVVNGISVMEGKNGLFVNMPSRKSKEVGENGEPVFKEVANPVTAEFREGLYGEILEDYGKHLGKSESLDSSRTDKEESKAESKGDDKKDVVTTETEKQKKSKSR